MGATRRIDHYALNRLAAAIHHSDDGICHHSCGVVTQIYQFIVSIKKENSIWIRREIPGMEERWNGPPLRRPLSIILL